MRKIVKGADVLPIETFEKILVPVITGIEECQGGWQCPNPRGGNWLWFPICLDQDNNEVVLIDGCLE